MKHVIRVLQFFHNFFFLVNLLDYYACKFKSPDGFPCSCSSGEAIVVYRHRCCCPKERPPFLPSSLLLPPSSFLLPPPPPPILNGHSMHVHTHTGASRLEGGRTVGRQDSLAFFKDSLKNLAFFKEDLDNLAF